MKRSILFLALVLVAVSLFAQVPLPEHQFAAGQWNWIGSRLYQNDANARLAKLNLRAAQSGPMIYEFNVRYENGLQDGHGGLGLHLFVDNALNAPSWGAGRSILLWLNYDENPVSPGFPRGFTAQVYRSFNNSYMELLESFDLNWALDFLTWDDLNYLVPVRIWANGDTGEVRVFDPTDPFMSFYWFFYINQRLLPLRGNWVAFRTNGIGLSIGEGLGF